MTLKLYGLRKCSTCTKAMDWLDAKEARYAFTDVKEQGLTIGQVRRWARALGGWEKLINRAGYTWRGLPRSDTANLTEERALLLAVNHPSLIRRPLIEHADGSVTVGFSDKIKSRLA
jgi:arsenate reductase (glutaredoxin)